MPFEKWRLHSFLCDQFQSLCELMYLMVALLLVGEGSLEITFLLFKVQRPRAKTGFKRGQMMPSGKVES